MEEKQKTPRGEKKNFPLTTLIVAEGVARAVNNAGGKISTKAISASLNVRGGALARKLAAAKRWGLIKGSGLLEITSLGKRIIIYADEENLAKSRKEAFVTVPLFAELYERFGSTLPTEQAFVAILANEYELSERDAKTMLTIYKEAIKFYLDAKNEENPKVAGTTTNTHSHGKPLVKKDGKISVYVSSPMGENNFKADDKKEFENMKKRLTSLFELIEDELPDNNLPSSTAEELNDDLSISNSSE
ncbi:hypothetical protein KAR52_01550 [Candidatus Pacearchaeota archaeon]|nr:hypothetical protein [Candidatus Pacearchaeota archaeon]